MDARTFDELPVVCPNCHAGMSYFGGEARCNSCGRTYAVNPFGFLELMERRTTYYLDPVSDDYAGHQETSGDRLYEDFLRPYLARASTERILDVGCGIGMGVSRMIAEGRQAFGLDLPSLSRYWAKLGHSPAHFYCGDAVSLPFPGASFDLVMSLGVIEHIGTVTGHSTLGPNYRAERQAYANELLRVTRPGGRLLIACPNKAFPIDIQHGPSDGKNDSSLMPVREWIYAKTRMNIHPVGGRYHLLSYPEVRHLFCEAGGARGFRPLPLQGYFGFGRFDSGFLRVIRALSQAYIRSLPALLRPTPLNPYLLVEIRK